MCDCTPDLNLELTHIAWRTIVLSEGRYGQHNSLVEAFRLNLNRMPYS